ncbi:hypothetical protein I7I53_09168 [Histoplasma capsulatum var. duboisii H88]|uniref:Uncharacterized protein n=1 Tax=Ajellomyces capsulatus (strain H88) TaxID=544711 RepID=A0A8A1L4E5_AJEC8|nr:hypothetical protein I7I53_09168 [Histoplasma capsulatum var. duboisii H88]
MIINNMHAYPEPFPSSQHTIKSKPKKKEKKKSRDPFHPVLIQSILGNIPGPISMSQSRISVISPGALMHHHPSLKITPPHNNYYASTLSPLD